MGTALIQWQQTRTAVFRASVEGRASACISMATLYASQSWAYKPVKRESFEKYGLPPTTEYTEIGPNQVLADFSDKTLMVARAVRLCLNDHAASAPLSDCLRQNVDEPKKHWVDDTQPRDHIPDRVIC